MSHDHIRDLENIIRELYAALHALIRRDPDAIERAKLLLERHKDYAAIPSRFRGLYQEGGDDEMDLRTLIANGQMPTTDIEPGLLHALLLRGWVGVTPEYVWLKRDEDEDEDT